MRTALSISSTPRSSTFERCGGCGYDAYSHGPHGACPTSNDLDRTDPRGYRDHEYRTCPRCQRRHVATLRLTSLILAAYPDLDDRSDSQVDHFDYCLSIH
jgi:hypothetical protein